MPPASNSITSYTPDKLIGGHLPIISNKRTLLSGENRTRGAVLGRTTTAAVVAAAVADAGNTGNGTITLAGTPFDGKAKEGKYRLTCIEPGANVGTFEVEDPEGIILGRAIVAVAFANGIAFTINDGGTDFVAGDSFSIEVSAVVHKYKRAATAAVDGSAVPVAILAEDCDATGADKECLVFERGDFNEAALNFGTGHTAATVREVLRARGIQLVGAQPAS